MSKILIDEEEYRSLLESEYELCALKNAGVFHWYGYSQAIRDFVEYNHLLEEYAQEQDIEPEFVTFDEFTGWLIEKRIIIAQNNTKDYVEKQTSNRIKDILFGGEE